MIDLNRRLDIKKCICKLSISIILIEFSIIWKKIYSIPCGRWDNFFHSVAMIKYNDYEIYEYIPKGLSLPQNHIPLCR